MIKLRKDRLFDVCLGKVSYLEKLKYKFCFILSYIRKTNSRWNNELNIKHKTES